MLDLDPYYSDAHNFLGAVYQEQDRLADAEREYRRALENPAYPTPEKVYLNLGLLYAEQGRHEEAIDTLRRAVEINTRYYQGHFELAALLDRAGQARRGRARIRGRRAGIPQLAAITTTGSA